jgi:hypothetical protein
MFRRIAPFIYLLIGVVVASQHSYLNHLSTVSGVLSALLAIFLWPLVLLGVPLTIG